MIISFMQQHQMELFINVKKHSAGPGNENLLMSAATRWHPPPFHFQFGFSFLTWSADSLCGMETFWMHSKHWAKKKMALRSLNHINVRKKHSID